MTKCILSVALILIVGAGYGQQASFSTNASFMLQASFQGRNNGSWIQKVTQVKVMVLDKKKAADAEQWDRLVRGLRDQRYEELVSIRKGENRVRLMSRDGDGVKELVFFGRVTGMGGFISSLPGNSRSMTWNRCNYPFGTKNSLFLYIIDRNQDSYP